MSPHRTPLPTTASPSSNKRIVVLVDVVLDSRITLLGVRYREEELYILVSVLLVGVGDGGHHKTRRTGQLHHHQLP